MGKPSLIIGDNKWATKDSALLGYNIDDNNKYKPKKATVSRNSVATYVDRDGIIQTAQPNIARIDFSEDSEGVLLTEPQSTNLVLWSEDFSNVVWMKQSGASVNGTNELVTDGTAGARVTQSIISTSTSHNWQVRMKAGTLYHSSIRIYNLTQAQDIVPTTNVVLTDEYQIFNITATSNYNVGDVILCYVYVGQSGSITAGNIFCEFTQLNTLSFTDSYIKTEGTTATRLGDSVTDAGDVNTFNSEEGVIFIDASTFTDLDINDRHFTLTEPTSLNYIQPTFRGNGDFRVFVVVNNVVQATLVDQTINLSDDNKIAVRWSVNNFSLWVNGIKVDEDLLGNTFPAGTLEYLTMTTQSFTSPFYGKTKAIQVFKTALSDAELIDLTT